MGTVCRRTTATLGIQKRIVHSKRPFPSPWERTLTTKKPLNFGELVGPLVLFKPNDGGRGILAPKHNSLAFLNTLHLTSLWTVEGLGSDNIEGGCW